MSILSKNMDSGGTASVEYPEPTAASVCPPTIAEGNEARMRHFALIQELATRMSDDDLHTILTRPSEERDDIGTITNVDFLSRFVPHYFKGHLIYKDVAIMVLGQAVDMAITNRIEEKEPIWSHELRKAEDGQWDYVLYWDNIEPQLPPSLTRIPTLKLEWQEGNAQYTLDACKIHPRITPTQLALGINFGPHFGTLGFLGVLRHNCQISHVVVTIGHIFDRAEYEDAGHLDLGIEITFEEHLNHGPQLPIVEPLKRGYYEMPAFRGPWKSGRQCLDEICLLEAQSLPADLLTQIHLNGDIDCNALFTIPQHIDGNFSRAYPGLLEESKVYRSLNSLIQRCGFLGVFKFGAQSGLTQGRLFKVEEDDTGLNQHPLFPFSENGLDTIRAYRLVIKWLEGSRFSKGGDSGSLVYTKHKRKIVPLGILFGSNEKKRTSSAWLLASWCKELELRLGAHLLFCSRSSCLVVS